MTVNMTTEAHYQAPQNSVYSQSLSEIQSIKESQKLQAITCMSFADLNTVYFAVSSHTNSDPCSDLRLDTSCDPSAFVSLQALHGAQN
ncbi:TPA: hypothetical protein ACH3X2_006076 [Trebouxia sp. C0005]